MLKKRKISTLITELTQHGPYWAALDISNQDSNAQSII